MYLAVATFGMKSLAITTQKAVTLNQATQENEAIDKLRNPIKVEEKTKNISSTSEKLSKGQVWVLGEQKEVQPESFTWVVNDTKKAAQQPFLELNKEQKKPAKKPSKKPNTAKKPA
ncbi:MAG: peptidase M43, partial [Cyanobacteria bacterium J06628_3]